MCSKEYGYVGRWCGPCGGIATAELIAPDWIITAPHVVQNKIQNPDCVDVTVCFTDGADKFSARVVEAFLRLWEPGMGWEKWKEKVGYEWEEVALARLNRHIDGIAPVELAENLIPCGETIKINMVGTTIRDEPVFGAYCAQDQNRRYLRRTMNGSADSERKHANRGDSGGAWLIERRAGPDVLVGIMQGLANKHDPDSGVATPPALCRQWIDETLGRSGTAKWVKVVYS
jgi:hypothetical protein